MSIPLLNVVIHKDYEFVPLVGRPASNIGLIEVKNKRNYAELHTFDLKRICETEIAKVDWKTELSTQAEVFIQPLLKNFSLNFEITELLFDYQDGRKFRITGVATTTGVILSRSV